MTGPTEALATFVQNLTNPTSPAGDGAFGIVTGAIWPTPIWSECVEDGWRGSVASAVA